MISFLFLISYIFLLIAVLFSWQMSSGGGRLIISSDGVWDALSAETAFDCCRGMPPDAAAAQIVKVCYICELLLIMFETCLFGLVTKINALSLPPLFWCHHNAASTFRIL